MYNNHKLCRMWGIEIFPSAVDAFELHSAYFRNDMRFIDFPGDNSVEHQRSNIEKMCQQKGWIPEWYEDADGHKSGRSEKGRHAWLSLKKRFGDPDVVALVANDLSRLHRKGWRVGDLIETLDRHDIALTLAAPGKQRY